MNAPTISTPLTYRVQYVPLGKPTVTVTYECEQPLRG